MPGSFLVLDEDLKLERWNRNHELISKYSPDELNGMPLSGYVPQEDIDKFREMLPQLQKSGSFSIEHRMITKDGDQPDIFTQAALLKEQDKAWILGFCMDITRLKLLQRELLHRTKNSLQVLTGLINWKIQKSIEPKIIIEDLKTKIDFIAIAYDKIDGNSDFSEISLKDYLYDLVYLHYTSLGKWAASAELEFHIEDVQILLDQAIPLGIVFSELMKIPAGGIIQIDDKDVIAVTAYQNDNYICFSYHESFTELNCSELIDELIVHQLGGMVLKKDEKNGIFEFQISNNLHKKRL